MNIFITEKEVFKEHPVEAAEILTSLKKKGVTNIGWNYSIAEKIDGDKIATDNIKNFVKQRSSKYAVSLCGFEIKKGNSKRAFNI